MRIGFVSRHPRSEFWAVINQFVRSEAQRQDVELLIQVAENVEQQSEAIDTMATQSVEAIIIAPRASRGLGAAINRARAAGIPVIMVENQPEDCAVDCVVLANDRAGAELAVNYVIEQTGGSATVAHLAGPEYILSGFERAEGVRSVLSRYPDMRVVFEAVSEEFVFRKGLPLMRAALAAHPDIQVVFAGNDELALGAAHAIAEAGRSGEVIVTGYDGLPEALIAINSRSMMATVRQPMREFGQLAVQMACQAARGQPVPPIIHTAVDLVTRDNLLDAALDALGFLPGIMQTALISADLLAQERSNLRTLIDTLPDTIVYIKDLDGHFTLVNSTLLAMMGLQRVEEAIGRTEFDFFPEERARRSQAQEQQIIATGEPILNHVEDVADSAGKTRWYLISKMPLYDVSKEMVGIVGMSRDITVMKDAEARQVQMREEVIRVQEEMLRQLSTPLIPISDTAMVMPLIGAIDAQRASQIIETLLNGLVAQGAEVVIIDITGVPVVNAQVADALIHAARAVRLIGAQVVLSGIRPEVAQTLVSLGIDLTGITTRSTLQSSIAYALRRPGAR